MLKKFLAWRLARRLPHVLPGGWLTMILLWSPVRRLVWRAYRRLKGGRRLPLLR